MASTPPVRDNLPTKEQKERDEILSVALNQPHRRGSDDKKLCDPLGRFCSSRRLRDECHAAGVRYAEIVGEAKTAQGFRVPGWQPGFAGFEALTDEQKQARKEAALMRLKSANAAISPINYKLPWILEQFCFFQLELPWEREYVVELGLARLADHFGLIDRGINRDRAFTSD
jgi:hypothetical protein